MSPLLSEVLFVFSNAGALVFVTVYGVSPTSLHPLTCTVLSDPSPIITLPNVNARRQLLSLVSFVTWTCQN